MMIINSTTILDSAFTIFNVGRIFMYPAQMRKFHTAITNLDTHSSSMWFSWVLSNLFISLQFYVNTRSIDTNVIISSINTLFLMSMYSQIIYKRYKYSKTSEKLIASYSRKTTNYKNK